MQVTVTHRLFKETTLTIERGETIGIVGPNGCGKSTLLHQLHDTIKTSALMTQEAQSEKLEFTSEELAFLSDWQVPALPYEKLSGGEQLKLRLAKALTSRAPILLLDEPTNHLDDDSLAKLTELVQTSSKTWIIVSHDRFFLDQVATTIWAIDDGAIDVVTGDYSHYETWRKAKRDSQAHAYTVQQKHIARVEQQLNELQTWSATMHKESTAAHHPKAMGAKEYYRTKAKRADKQVKSKRKKLEQQLQEHHIDKVSKEHTIHFSLAVERTIGKRIIELKNVAVSPILQDVNLVVTRGEKVAILGANGAGKSTLLHAIYTSAITSGELWLTEAANIGYLSQSVFDLPLEQTVAEFFTYDNFEEEGTIRTQLILLGFTNAHWHTAIHELSMGERIKLKIAKFIMERRNVLLLDEPTNHLDIASREQLEDALLAYEGTLIFVSHDRYFREKLATRSVTVENGTLHLPQAKQTMNEVLLALETEKQAVLGQLSYLTPKDPQYAVLDARFTELLKLIKKAKS
ncbi:MULTISPECIES: ribosomal protection-like ABC-F family protein [Sporosarcina]|uniref:Macrolide transport system ATP-binding/permease protein n=2 Tax=Sporosarcina newyorkensis TaxID=759851 RepID=A0A1T4YXQ1_9BACL|nr:ABC-F family ATP-binding cassette domain-containing protein [Sporosarcina newyorkensis]EGQ24134.1 ABC superfamily ATP binding cassette transporter, ABC protein [Sporosarcina newyorkensis 2681]SKB06554.1 macrolide transport system ATP-binding/permease protein [Sporosarcina newyorkensis]